MTWILWLVIAILWTVVCLAAGYAGGKDAGKKEKDGTVEDYFDGAGGPAGPRGPVGATGAMGMSGPIGPEGPPGPPFDLNHVVADKELGLTLPEWMSSVNSRLTRVERKSGMSV